MQTGEADADEGEGSESLIITDMSEPTLPGNIKVEFTNNPIKINKIFFKESHSQSHFVIIPEYEYIYNIQSFEIRFERKTID